MALVSACVRICLCNERVSDDVSVLAYLEDVLILQPPNFLTVESSNGQTLQKIHTRHIQYLAHTRQRQRQGDKLHESEENFNTECQVFSCVNSSGFSAWARKQRRKRDFLISDMAILTPFSV